MSLNTTTNGERFQTVYVYRYDYYYIAPGYGFNYPHLVGYTASLNKPDLNEKERMIEILTLDTEKMTARPIDDYFKKILFVWNDDKYKRKYNKWREWVRAFETK